MLFLQKTVIFEKLGIIAPMRQIILFSITSNITLDLYAGIYSPERQ